jgi:hypothetical protein
LTKTTDIAGWLDENEPEDEQDRADLLASIRNVEENGNYAVTKKGGRLLVTGWGELTVALANETAKARLIREVEILRFDDDVGKRSATWVRIATPERSRAA